MSKLTLYILFIGHGHGEKSKKKKGLRSNPLRWEWINLSQPTQGKDTLSNSSPAVKLKRLPN